MHRPDHAGGDDTPGRVERLCMKAMRPLRADLMQALGLDADHRRRLRVPRDDQPAVQILQGRLPIAAVSTAFPAGLSSMETKLREIELSVAAGATEIDIVITRQHVLTGNWQALYDEMLAYRQACGEAHVKAILATGDLVTLENVAKASWVCMMAGADFIKTSTGKEGVNATIPVSLVMVRAIREYYEQTGFRSATSRPAACLHREVGAAVPDRDEGRAGQRMAAAAPVPHRRLQPADRHRAPARAPCHRLLLGRSPPRATLK
jgi:deoxyribose-phosphate aldolase